MEHLEKDDLYSKDITEKLYVGLGSYFSGGTDWSLGLDLGVLYKFGNLGFLKDSKLGVSLTGIGKPYNPRINGVREQGKMIGYPSVVTPHIGFSSYLVSIPKFKMGFHADLAAPAFCNMTFDTGLSMLIMDMVTIRTAYTLNVLETINKKQTHIPSVGIGVRIKISPKNKDGSVKQGLEQTEIAPQFATRPFYNNIWAFGFGVTTKFGTKDTEGPKIEVGNTEGIYISPNNDGIKDEQTFSLHTNIEEGIEKWSFAIHTQGKTLKTIYLYKEMQEKLPKTIKWNGKDGDSILEGNFIAELKLEYTKGDVVSANSTEFLSSITPPKLGVALKPKYFSPDNDGIDDDLFISLKAITEVGIDSWSFEISEPQETGGKHFWNTTGKGKITDEIIWDGRSSKGEVVQSATDYPFTFTAKDVLGLSSTIKGYIPVDILVIRDGDKLKIAVPSIIFRPNADDFKGLEENVVDKNTYVLKRVAQILNKFTDYQVQVEGHANSTTGSETEEKRDLIPLSTLRAKAVMQILIKNGVRSSRLSAVGMGGSRPVASLSDRDNWWKNRRVEFVLIK